MDTNTFKERVSKLEGINYSVTGDYVNARTKIELKHNTCGNVYSVRPDDFRRGRRCPKCSNLEKNRKLSKTHEEFIQEVHSKVGNEYDILSEYKNWETAIRMRHNTCGNVYEMQPNSFLRGRRCPPCQHKVQVKKRTKSNRDFLKEVENLYGREFITLEEYKTNIIKIKVKHERCGNVWSVRPSNLLSGFGCPRCNQSSGERLVTKVLDSLEVLYLREHSFDDLKSIRSLYFDFFIPHTRVLIEYQGIQHYKHVKFFGDEEVFHKQQRHDSMKRTYAKENGYTLIEIPYTNNSFEEVKEFIKSSSSVLA